jgi:hypothetical protein
VIGWRIKPDVSDNLRAIGSNLIADSVDTSGLCGITVSIDSMNRKAIFSPNWANLL